MLLRKTNENWTFSGKTLVNLEDCRMIKNRLCRRPVILHLLCPEVWVRELFEQYTWAERRNRRHMGEEKAGSREGKCNIMKEGKNEARKAAYIFPNYFYFFPHPTQSVFFSPRVFCVTWVALPLIYTAAMSRGLCEHSPRRCVDTNVAWV